MCQPHSSIKSGQFPSLWKIAKLYPLLKKGVAHDMDNYRPLSILCAASKIIEKHVHNHLYGFLTNHSLLCTCQSAFRKCHSCQTGLTKLVDSWYTALNNGDLVGAVMIDLRKAFDLIDHKVLLKKLSLYGCSLNTVAWLSSYLYNRSQVVSLGNLYSESSDVQYGVPQGSILGPLLFLVFVNDMPLQLHNSDADMYADDTTVHTSGSTLTIVEDILNTDLHNIETWCTSNGLVINCNKTKCMTISTRQKMSQLDTPDMSLFVDNKKIEPVTSHVMLGVHVDQNLAWKIQIRSVCNKISSKLALLSRIKHYLPFKARCLFYNSYVLPHFDYCCNLWSGCTDLDRLCKLQKRAARTILNVSYYEHSAPLFKYLNWLPLKSRIVFNQLVLVYKALNNLAPEYLKDLLLYTNEVHGYGLRSSTGSLYPPLPQIALFKNSFSYSSTLLWNKLPNDVRLSTTLNTFKAKCNKYIKDNTDIKNLI